MSTPFKPSFYVGTAGWTLPKEYARPFGPQGTHLERYSSLLNAVEINSSFYREHKAITYARWADSVPEDFRFSIKLWKQFTHEQRLQVDKQQLQENLLAVSRLRQKWGCLLVQLPPSLVLDIQIAKTFFSNLRDIYQGPVALEPRHPTWIAESGKRLMQDFALTKVFADPELCPLENSIAGNIIYYRLHGSPRIYKSDYEIERLKLFLNEINEKKKDKAAAWCVFDNTSYGFATKNALEMTALNISKAPASFSEQPFRSHLE